MSLLDRIMTSHRMALGVKRYHSWPVLQTQTVADHTCHVFRIYWEIFGTPKDGILEYILWHDCTEMYTGDIPFPQKKNFPELKKAVDSVEEFARKQLDIPPVALTDGEKGRVKVCDLLEMWEFGRDEINLGNKYALPIVERTLWAASKLADELGVTDKVNKWIEGHL